MHPFSQPSTVSRQTNLNQQYKKKIICLNYSNLHTRAQFTVNLTVVDYCTSPRQSIG